MRVDDFRGLEDLFKQRGAGVFRGDVREVGAEVDASIVGAVAGGADGGEECFPARGIAGEREDGVGADVGTEYFSALRFREESLEDRKTISKYIGNKFITISPGSVWFTKTLPSYKWIELIQKYKNDSPETTIYLLGSKAESNLGDTIIAKSGHDKIANLAGKLSFLESTALMECSEMNYVNDSAPLHMAGAINAPVTAVFCSTVPRFGFGPLSDLSKIAETNLNLKCRPCGLHGYKSCPMTHFKCAHSIETIEILA